MLRRLTIVKDLETGITQMSLFVGREKHTKTVFYHGYRRVTDRGIDYLEDYLGGPRMCSSRICMC